MVSLFRRRTKKKQKPNNWKNVHSTGNDDDDPSQTSIQIEKSQHWAAPATDGRLCLFTTKATIFIQWKKCKINAYIKCAAHSHEMLSNKNEKSADVTATNNPCARHTKNQALILYAHIKLCWLDFNLTRAYFSICCYTFSVGGIFSLSIFIISISNFPRAFSFNLSYLLLLLLLLLLFNQPNSTLCACVYLMRVKWMEKIPHEPLYYLNVK